MACTANVLLEVEDIVPHRFIQARLDSRLTVWRCSCMLMCACAKRLELRHHEIKSAKSFVEVHPRKSIPSKYTRYTVVSLVPSRFFNRTEILWPSIPLEKKQPGNEVTAILEHSEQLPIPQY